MLKLSKDANPNYLAKIVKLTNIRKHENADKLQIAIIDFQNVIIDMKMKLGDVCVFFPAECQINSEFLSYLNAFRDKELNQNKDEVGFFDKKARVKAIKLRGEYSMGFLIPIEKLEFFIDKKITEPIGTEFDYIDDVLFVKKYVIPSKQQGQGNKQGKVAKRISRLVDGQFHFHIDTTNLRKNIYNIKPDDHISVSHKLHGTSAIYSNVLVKKKLNSFYKILDKLKINIQKTEYDLLYSSRKVIKNEYETKDTPGFYKVNIWEVVKNEIQEYIPKNYTIYGEIVGYINNETYIQKEYDYGCPVGTHEFYVYRITLTNFDGQVFELSNEQITEFCKQYNLKTVPIFYDGLAKDLYPELDIANHWHENFIQKLEEQFTNKDCFMCKNKVPEEGIVVRKQNPFSFDAYKLKSYRFLEFETKQLDEGVENIEDNQ